MSFLSENVDEILALAVVIPTIVVIYSGLLGLRAPDPHK